MDEFDVVVAERHDVADGVVALHLRHAAGADLPPWAPGCHIDVLLTPQLTRQYSLCGSPSDLRSWRIAILLEPNGRGGSSYVHNQVATGDMLRVRGPRNNFELKRAPRYKFVAGGIGITPILPMIRAADHAGADWTLHYGGRTRESMAFVDELAAYEQRVVIRPQDAFGLLDLDDAVGDPMPDTLIYCCGPPPLINAVEKRCELWPREALRVERFQPAASVPDVCSQAFVVEIASTGEQFAIPVERSILSVLRDNGFAVLSSCEEGVCGTCETGVIAGVVDHRDFLLTDDEKSSNSTMMICVSRAVDSKLVLDL